MRPEGVRPWFANRNPALASSLTRGCAETELPRPYWNLPSGLGTAALTRIRPEARAEDPGPDVVGDSLDFLIGTWTREEAEELDEAIEELSRVDPGLWA